MKIAKIIDSLFVDPKLEEQLILPFEEFRPVVKKKELTLDSFIDGLTYGKVKEGTNYWESQPEGELTRRQIGRIFLQVHQLVERIKKSSSKVNLKFQKMGFLIYLLQTK